MSGTTEKSRMTKKGNRAVLRLVAGFLRSLSGLNQADFGKAAKIAQADISRYEKEGTVPEMSLRRMAKAAKVPWPLVALLRRFVEAFLAAVASRRSVASVEPLGLGALEPAVMAATPYLIEDSVEKPKRQPLEEALREAEEIWTNLQRHPIARRRHLIELSLQAGRSWALALRIGEESGRVAAVDAKEALELSKLALSIAERVPRPEKDRIQGYCWALVACACQAAGDLPGSNEALARARRLWPAESDRELLTDWPPRDLEAVLAAGRRAVERS
jgi:transcriptional regulator with XRE-family HTH domain